MNYGPGIVVVSHPSNRSAVVGLSFWLGCSVWFSSSFLLMSFIFSVDYMRFNVLGSLCFFLFVCFQAEVQLVKVLFCLSLTPLPRGLDNHALPYFDISKPIPTGSEFA